MIEALEIVGNDADDSPVPNYDGIYAVGNGIWLSAFWNEDYSRRIWQTADDPLGDWTVVTTIPEDVVTIIFTGGAWWGRGGSQTDLRVSQDNLATWSVVSIDEGAFSGQGYLPDMVRYDSDSELWWMFVRCFDDLTRVATASDPTFWTLDSTPVITPPAGSYGPQGFGVIFPCGSNNGTLWGADWVTVTLTDSLPGYEGFSHFFNDFVFVSASHPSGPWTTTVLHRTEFQYTNNNFPIRGQIVNTLINLLPPLHVEPLPEPWASHPFFASEPERSYSWGAETTDRFWSRPWDELQLRIGANGEWLMYTSQPIIRYETADYIYNGTAEDIYYASGGPYYLAYYTCSGSVPEGPWTLVKVADAPWDYAYLGETVASGVRIAGSVYWLGRTVGGWSGLDYGRVMKSGASLTSLNTVVDVGTDGGKYPYVSVPLWAEDDVFLGITYGDEDTGYYLALPGAGIGGGIGGWD